MKKLLQSLPFLLFISFTSIISAQTTIWNGDGDGISWNDADNWDTNMIPQTGDIVRIGGTVLIRGNAANNPGRLIIEIDGNVILDLDITIDNTTVVNGCIKPFNNAMLTLGSPDSNRVFTLLANAPNTDGIQHDANNNPASIIVSSSTTINISTARYGIYFGGNVVNTITNNGSIHIDNSTTHGIFNENGYMLNNGTLQLFNSDQDNIHTQQNMENGPSGILILKNAGDDGIEINNGATFANNGEIIDSLAEMPMANDAGIAVGSDLTAGTLLNHGAIAIHGGTPGGNGRGIIVEEMGTFSNFGQISLTGGNNNARILSRGTSTNELGGTIDFTDGRINVNVNSFDNFGLLLSTLGTPGVFAGAGTAVTNYAFFDFSLNSFANGTGTITDLGIDLNDPAEYIIDAGATCTVDVAEAIYTYFTGVIEIGTTDAMGGLTIAEGTVPSNSITITPDGLPTVEIQLTNLCSEAIAIPTVTFWGILSLTLSMMIIGLTWIRSTTYLVYRSKI